MLNFLITLMGLCFIAYGAWGLIACLISSFKNLNCNLPIPLGLEICGIILVAIH